MSWEGPCHLPTGVVTPSLARVATGSLTADLPPPGSKNPKIALKLAEIQTDEQGKVRARHVLGEFQGVLGACGQSACSLRCVVSQMASPVCCGDHGPEHCRVDCQGARSQVSH